MKYSTIILALCAAAMAAPASPEKPGENSNASLAEGLENKLPDGESTAVIVVDDNESEGSIEARQSHGRLLKICSGITVHRDPSARSNLGHCDHLRHHILRNERTPHLVPAFGAATRVVREYGTCKFRTRSSYALHDHKVGDGDIAAIYDTARQHFANGNVIGFLGKMRCPFMAGGGWTDVEFNLED